MRKQIIKNLNRYIDKLEMIDSELMFVRLERATNKEVMLQGIELACILNSRKGKLTNGEALSYSRFLSMFELHIEIIKGWLSFYKLFN